MLKEALTHMSHVFDHSSLVQGQALYEHERVLHTRLSEGLLRGRVKGINNQLYDVYMDLRKWPNLPSNCSCSMQNCAHAAACLLFINSKGDNIIPAAAKTIQNFNKLDNNLNNWLKKLNAEDNKGQEEKNQQVIYLIDPDVSSTEHTVRIKLSMARTLKKGGYGRKQVFNQLTESKKDYFTPEDNEIIAKLLFNNAAYGWFDNLRTNNSNLLEKILATGRVYHMEDQEIPLFYGDVIHPECEWELSPQGDQHFVLRQETKHIRPLLLDECWYFDQDNHTLGKLVTPFSGVQLVSLLDAPPVALEQAAVLAKKLKKICPDIPGPLVFTEKEIRLVEPEPIIIFDAREFQFIFANETLFTVQLMFDYEGSRVNYYEKTHSVVQKEKDHLIEFPRDVDFESKVMQFLQSRLELEIPNPIKNQRLKLQDAMILADINTPEDLNILYETLIPDWKAKGWQIEFLSPLYQEELYEEEVEWYSDLEEKDNDFFSFQLGILVEGKSVNIVPLVAELISKHKGQNLDAISDDSEVRLPLNEGQVLVLTMERIKPLIRLLLQFGTHRIREDNLELTRYQLMLMKEIELATAATRARWRGAETLRNQLQQLSTQNDMSSIEPPKGLKAELRDYQHHGLNWLEFLRSSGFAGILADDMGLGKTVQTLALLLREKEQGRLKRASLIIAPTSLVGNWEAESKRFAPDLRVLVFHGSERHIDSFDDFDLIVSTYGLIQRDKDRFLDYHFYYLILDEAQFIKNARTKTTQIIQQLHAAHRLCLTGTPMENHLGELWSLFHFLMPGLLGDNKQFRQWFRTPIEKNGDENRRHVLIRRVQPFMLRRTKNEVIKELPLKTEMLRTINLAEKQRDLYEAIRMSMEKKVRDAIARQGLSKSHIVLLDALLKLRQVCCDPRLLNMSEAEMAHGHSAKLDALMELLDNLMEEGRRVLVFSQFTSMLSLIEKSLAARKYTWLKLTGETQNRQALVESFQQGKAPIFLISLKAGGTGLNLTRADTVIHYDPWWNPAVEDQATDRSHRIGQENPVFVYKLITNGTVEEAILKMQGKKRELVSGILSTENSGKLTLTESDIESFFMPL